MTEDEFWQQTDEGDYRVVRWRNPFGGSGTFSGIVQINNTYYGLSIEIRTDYFERVFVDYEYIQSVT